MEFHRGGLGMARGNASGIRLTRNDIPTVLGMQARGDRDHDIAAWFGVNQGRVAEAKDGRYGGLTPTPSHQLPPKGPPGLKGRDLREAIGDVLAHIAKNGFDARANTMLSSAIKEYDRNRR
jgi:hypothetical protein